MKRYLLRLFSVMVMVGVLFSLFGLNMAFAGQYNEKQWYLGNDNSQSTGINLTPVCSEGVEDDSEVVVAILDSGVDINHPDLKNNIWKNTIEGLEGEYGRNLAGDNNDVSDTIGHGTHCAGLIAASGEKGISGIGKNVKIMPLKIDKDGKIDPNAILKAYDYMIKAKKAGVNLVAANNSWTLSGELPLLENRIDELGKLGVTSIFAAGNDGKNNDKNKFLEHRMNKPYVITVGASKKSGSLWKHSNYGKNTVDIVAPGKSIISTFKDVTIDSEKKKIFRSSDNTCCYSFEKGTSCAAPIISGSYALLKSYNTNWTQEELKARIVGGAVKSEALKGKSVSDGRFDISIAIFNPNPYLSNVDINNDIATIDGYFFGTESSSVNVNNVACDILSWTDKQIKVKLPNKLTAGRYNFSVISDNNRSGRLGVKL